MVNDLRFVGFNSRLGLGAGLAAFGLIALLVRSGMVQGQDQKAAPAAMPAGITFGLGSLPLLSDAQSRSATTSTPRSTRSQWLSTRPTP